MSSEESSSLSQRDASVPSPSIPGSSGNTVNLSAVRATYYYSSPFPHPDHLERYESLHPGAAKIIFEGFEKQGRHRRELESVVIPGQVSNARLGIYIQGLAVIAYAVSTTVSALFTPAYVPISITAIFCASTVAIYIYGKKKQSDAIRAKRDAETPPSSPLK